MVNDCYHRYNVNQYPFIYLNIITDRQTVDINLTPDKRQLLLNNEKILLALIKKSLIATFGNIPSTFKMQNTTITSMMGSTEETNSQNTSKETDENLDEIPPTSTQKFCEVLSQWKQTGDTKGPASPTKTKKRKCNDEITTRTFKLQKIQEFLSREISTTPNNNTQQFASYKSESESEEETENTSKLNVSHNISTIDKETINKESLEYDELITKQSPKYVIERIDCKNMTPLKTKPLSFVENKLETSPNTSIPTSPDSFIKNTVELDESDSESEYSTQPCSELQVSLAELTLNLKAEENLLQERKHKAKLERLRFKSEINPNQNKNAEAELQKEISKECFAKMEILGQFNLGFIITKLDTDLFIVDQHATDEKYNFETLQKSVQLQHQPLAVPQSLDLTAVNEMILIDHLPIFEKNGFKFEIDHNGKNKWHLR